MGKSVKYRFIEFFVFDCDSFPISFQSGITFPLVALDKNFDFDIYVRYAFFQFISVTHIDSRYYFCRQQEERAMIIYVFFLLITMLRTVKVATFFAGSGLFLSHIESRYFFCR